MPLWFNHPAHELKARLQTLLDQPINLFSGAAFSGLLFIALAVIVVFSAFLVATQRDIVRAATALFVCLLGVAGLYLFLAAEFLAFVQVMVYVGGTTVLILFGVMLTARKPVETSKRGSWRPAAGIVAAGAVLLPLLGVIIGLGTGGKRQWAAGTGAPGETIAPHGVRHLGDMLLTTYVGPFVIASFVLLFALVGAAYLVRRKEEPPGTGTEE